MVQVKFLVMKNCKKMYWAYWKKPKLNKNRNEMFHVDIIYKLYSVGKL